jgi:UDP-N-acetylglucosamine--N-acetylmuramyl-(pentapeptide) pyrophosphoryl-undecaprenol N-acetylglucosamine transferase
MNENKNKQSLSLRVNILLTGGHAATTAIATIEEIQKRHSNWHLFWVGPKSAVEGKFVPTLASTIMPKMGVKFIPITTGRLQRRFTIWTIPSLLKIPYGILQSFKIVFEIKPKIIISFGGYASVPVCFAAWVLRIPVFIHEQTVAVGLANRINSIFATKILIARQESAKYFPEKKIILIGNPINAEIAKIKAKSKISKTPVIYITGGSSGAQKINKVISDSLYELLKKYKLIHQTGKLDYDEFKKKRESFPSDLQKNYEVYDFIDPADVPNVFDRADIVVSRAGANTLSEIMVTKRPAVLIPIPWTAYDEQTENAKMVENIGLAKVLEEKDLSTQNLLNKLDEVVKNWKNMVNKSDNSIADLDRNASKRFVDEIELM